MTDIVDRKQLIQQEETKFEAAASESVFTRVGAIANFIANREIVQHDVNLNGSYNIVTLPQQAIDGFITYPWPYEIYDVMVMAGSNIGDSGTTELDVKWKPELSGVYQSIFSTTPKFTNPTVQTTVRPGQVVTGFTAPVLSKTQFDAWDILKVDLLQARVGVDVEGAFIKIFIRPRDVS